MRELALRWGCVLACAAAITFTGCGDSNESAPRESVVGELPALERTLISDDELSTAPSGSARRAFLRYWSALQFQDWAGAAAFYEDRLLRHVGLDTVIEGLKGQADYFRTNKPRVVRTTRLGGRESVYFLIDDPSGRRITRSISWLRRGGSWRIFYDPYLDAAIQTAVQNATQLDIDPTSREAADRAVRAGAAAAQLQSRYLKRYGLRAADSRPE